MTRLWIGRSGVQIPVWAGVLSLLQNFETGSGAHTIPIQWVTRFFPRGKATGV